MSSRIPSGASMNSRSRPASAKGANQRTKLDPRLSYLLSLPARRLKALKHSENERQRRLADEFRALKQAFSTNALEKGELENRLANLGQRMFAPLTTGIYLDEAPAACVADMLK